MNSKIARDRKIAKISKNFAEIMKELGLDLTDPSLKGTPARVAKMYIDELCAGLDEDKFPRITVFPNDKKYDQMLLEKNITLHSMCEHHFLPIVGRVHIAYFPGDKIIGLSKLNRIVQYYGAKPQLQERLTQEIAEKLVEILKTEDVAVVIDAVHDCCRLRGAKDATSSTLTSFVGGRFRSDSTIKKELFDLITLR